MSVVLALGIGGVIGALARYLVARALPVQTGAFPWSTFVINVSGSLALGFLVVLLLERFPRDRFARLFLGTGILGAYTTFSTLEVDAALLFRAHDILVGVLYVVTSLAAGLAAVWLGTFVARVSFRARPGDGAVQ
jgi:CrcB protein